MYWTETRSTSTTTSTSVPTIHILTIIHTIHTIISSHFRSSLKTSLESPTPPMVCLPLMHSNYMMIYAINLYSLKGFEFVWRLTYLLFNATRFWLYRIIAAIIAIPLALLWAVIFATINLTTIWFFTPLLRIFDIILHYIHRVRN
jgi:hypothetical protein